MGLCIDTSRKFGDDELWLSCLLWDWVLGICLEFRVNQLKIGYLIFDIFFNFRLPSSVFRLPSFHASRRPNGVSASDAILKCCPAQGIPMIVIPRRIPKKTWVSIIHIPPIKSQIMFMIVERQPGA